MQLKHLATDNDRRGLDGSALMTGTLPPRDPIDAAVELRCMLFNARGGLPQLNDIDLIEEHIKLQAREGGKGI